MTSVRILVFAKAPTPGAVKTRLIPALGAQGAARLAALMLADTLERARAAKVGPVELCMSPAPADGQWRGVPLPSDIILSDQGESDLGARMERAARRALAENDAVLLIGTDCPDLSAHRLRLAARALRDFNCAIHPAADGGYVLLGLRRSAPALFSDVPWGSAEVARSTLDRLHTLDWSTLVGAVLHDIDEPLDLVRLPPAWRVALEGVSRPAEDARLRTPDLCNTSHEESDHA